MCNQCQQKIYQFKYDYFFYYLLIYSSRLRCFLCQYISGDNTIQKTYVKNSKTFKSSYQNKKLILDVVVEMIMDVYMILK